MKKFFIAAFFLTTALLFFSSCGGRDSQAGAPQPKVWFESKDLDVQAAAEMKQEQLYKLIHTEFTPDVILKIFGPGTHSFYMRVAVFSDVKSSQIIFHKDLYVTPDGSIYRKLESDPFAERQPGNMEHPPFGNRIFNAGLYFELKPGMISGKPVSSDKYFTVTMGYDKSKKEIYSLTVREFDFKSYEPVFTGAYKTGDFNTKGVTTIAGGEEALAAKIRYPQQAKKIGVTGRVLVAAFIDENGKVVGRQLVKGIGFGCDESAMAAVSAVQFYPPHNGKKCARIIPVDFELEYESPDAELSAEAITFTPAKCRVGQECTISYKLVNVGASLLRCANYQLAFYIDNKLVSFCGSNKFMNPHEKVEYKVKWTPQASGKHEYILYIDPENAAHESNRKNNVVRGTVEVF